jgi:hypothetical protein
MREQGIHAHGIPIEHRRRQRRDPERRHPLRPFQPQVREAGRTQAREHPQHRRLHGFARRHEVTGAPRGFGQAAQVRLGRAAANAHHEHAMPRGLRRCQGASIALICPSVTSSTSLRAFVQSGEGRRQRGFHLGAPQIGLQRPHPALRGQPGGLGGLPQTARAVLHVLPKRDSAKRSWAPSCWTMACKARLAAAMLSPAIDPEQSTRILTAVPPASLGGKARAEAGQHGDALGCDAGRVRRSPASHAPVDRPPADKVAVQIGRVRQ